VLRRIAFLCLAVLTAGAAHAQTFPDRPIRLIAPFPAGGLADVLARAIGDEMSKSLGQPVIVENRAGAGGNTGADAVAKATPDGYTLLMSSAGILTANPHLYAKMPFDAATAFIPVSNVAQMNMVLVVHPKVPAQNLKEFIALAKAQPGKLNFGSPGIGTTGHLGLAMLMHAAQIQLTHVPYKGAAPAVTDLIAGQIDGVVDNPPTVIAHIQGGKLRPLAFAARERLPLLPDSFHGGQRSRAAAACPLRRTARFVRQRRSSPGVAAGRADRGRGGPRQFRGDVMVRHRRAGRHAASCDRAAAQGDR